MTQAIHEGERIAKVMARSGLCSRRDAEQWIEDGRVQVNGETITSPALNVQKSDKILVDGEALRHAEPTRLFLFHKPVGVLATAFDPLGRPTIYDVLPKNWPRLISIGRLDMNTEGLLLLTNDGELARYMELPTTGLRRVYRVRVHGYVNMERLEKLKKGVTVDGVRYGAIHAEIEGGESQKSSNTWIRVELQEGKNREIRNVMQHLGLQVNRLVRLSYGSFLLGNLPRGVGTEVSSGILAGKIPGYFNKGKAPRAKEDGDKSAPTKKAAAPKPKAVGTRKPKKPRGQ